MSSTGSSVKQMEQKGLERGLFYGLSLKLDPYFVWADSSLSMRAFNSRTDSINGATSF